MLVNSPFDLLMACWKGVVMIMTLGAKKTASEMVWELGAQQLWPVLIAMAAVVMFFLVKPYWPRLSQWLQAKSEAICHVSKDQWWSDRNLWIALGFVGLWGVFVGADPNLSHRADRILSQGWGPAFRGPAVDKCRSVLAL